MNKKILSQLIALYSCFLIYGVIVNNTIQTGDKLMYIVASLFVPWLAMGAFKLLKIKITPSMLVVIWVFSAIAMIGGSVLNFYRFAYFDKVLHFTSGLMFATLCLMLYGMLRPLNAESNKDLILQLLFVNGVNVLIAFIWELYEFSLLVFFNIDAINHYTQGVYDTIGDMLVCFVGGIIISCFIVAHYKTKRNNVVYHMVDEFLTVNGLEY